MTDPCAFLFRHHVEFAAPRSCGSYGGLSLVEAVDTAIEALAPFGYTLSPTSDGFAGASLWASPDGQAAIALVEGGTSSRHGYLIVAGGDEVAIDRLTEILRKLLPLVELNGGRGSEIGWALDQLAPDTFEELPAA